MLYIAYLKPNRLFHKLSDDFFEKHAETKQLVMLLQGSAKIEYETGLVRTVSAGDYFVIKAHEKHKVSYTSENPPCIWLCIFYK